MSGIGKQQQLEGSEPSNVEALVKTANSLYESTFGNDKDDGESVFCSVAPGRVNLIGEHTDYTGGFVFPMAIAYSTVCYGEGKLVDLEDTVHCEIVSINQSDCQVVKFVANEEMKPFDKNDDQFWANYVLGVVAQYVPDAAAMSKRFSIRLAIAGDVPLGSGLSSSASLEVAVATFLECILKEYDASAVVDAKTRALRCQKAENEFCGSPCGIMDQYVSSAGTKDAALMIDCRSLEYVPCVMKTTQDVEKPVIVVCNSNVTHSIAGGEYPIRVAQCKAAELVLGKSLRDATLEDVENNKDKLSKDGDDVIYRRARHVVTENARVEQAKIAFENGTWNLMGSLMNASHDSMKDDYEVSCDEIDILVKLAQSHKGVYGSRLTGGGFGGCTVTLVEAKEVDSLIAYLTLEYKLATKVSGCDGRDCFAFPTNPESGTRQLTMLP